jgi:hypothetical protein
VVHGSALGTDSCGGGTLFLIRHPLPENTRAAAAVAASLVILGCLVAGGIFGRYPFGGKLRQQFILFPFAVIWGCVLLDRSTALIRHRHLRTAFMGFAALLITGLWAVQFYQLPRVSMEFETDDMIRFRESFPSPPAVYVDQFSLIPFFSQYLDWNWRFAGKVPFARLTNIYRVSKGTDEFLVFRDKRPWNADFEDPALYNELAAVLESQTLPSITTFCVRGTEKTPGVHTESAFENQILQHASSANLCMKNLELLDCGLSEFVELTSGNCQTRSP